MKPLALVAILAVATLAVAVAGCRRVAPPGAPAKVARRAAAASEGQRAMLDLCKRLAVRVPRRAAGGPAPGADVPTFPATRSADPAVRRLEALRLVDDLQQRLDKDPRNPALHFLSGRVHLEKLENPAAAEGHLCRAVLEAPASAEYRLTLRSGWLTPGFEERLEESLGPSERHLPWREALADARRLKGVDGPERAAAFEEAIAAMAVVRAGLRLRRERSNATFDDVAASLASWADGTDPESLRAVVTFPTRYASRTDSLHDREGRTTPPQVWPSNGRTRAYLHARGKGALEAVLAFAGDRLRGTVVTLHLAADDRHLALTGRIVGARFTLVSFAASPDVPEIRAAARE